MDREVTARGPVGQRSLMMVILLLFFSASGSVILGGCDCSTAGKRQDLQRALSDSGGGVGALLVPTHTVNVVSKKATIAL